MTGPLTGLRVLDIATIIAGPSAASILGDFGATVIKVELPGRGDGARSFPPFKEGKALWWKVTNRGKTFITLDLRKPKGAKLFLDMLPKFDVLVENFRPDTMDKWGLDAKTLWQRNPHLTVLRVSGFGQTGPYRNRPGFARMFEAMGGLTHITGEPNGQPMHSGYPLADNIGGLFGAIGILAALYQRLQHPDAPGEEIDLALLESTLKILEFLPIEHEQLGVSRQRAGNTNQYSAPASVFCTKDQRWVSLSGSTDPVFCANCRAIEREDLITHPSYVNNSQRVQHSHALNAVFEAWFAQKTFDEALRTFEIHGGTLAPVYDMEQIAADPQIQARHSICDVTDSDFGSVRMSNVVPRFKYNPSTIQHSARDMGFDNLRFFSEELGLHVAEIAELQAEGVI